MARSRTASLLCLWLAAAAPGTAAAAESAGNRAALESYLETWGSGEVAGFAA